MRACHSVRRLESAESSSLHVSTTMELSSFFYLNTTSQTQHFFRRAPLTFLKSKLCCVWSRCCSGDNSDQDYRREQQRTLWANNNLTAPIALLSSWRRRSGSRAKQYGHVITQVHIVCALPVACDTFFWPERCGNEWYTLTSLRSETLSLRRGLRGNGALILSQYAHLDRTGLNSGYTSSNAVLEVLPARVSR